MSQTVLVTGSSSGFGRAAVHRFLDQGWNVVATLRDPSRWTGAPDGRLLVTALDVRDTASVLAGVAAAVERFGRIDCVVNNAGVGLFAVFEGTPERIIEDVVDTNLYGPMRVIRAVLPHFHRQGGGRIVNVTSSNVTVPSTLMAAYSASKGGLHGFSEAISYELSLRNVEVKVVEPGLSPGTNFVGQTTARFGSSEVPAPYAAYVQERAATFDAPPPPGYFATDDDVAAAIHEAAVDETGRFRWRVGADALDFARARQASDEDYDAWRRSHFAPAR
ncbi:NAD(P)-dependent dehydrogenase (short-subunit alcohol dehydrogenase family) [Catenuloplanes nepalensis]|uniref:NAD(P)-dependent dehydrogenase (Short-subunit alcohol dehydrogenase family) n=1 Tax=Catenuloplanes nepalensis TaxID=587533 RepID=A0ABT9MPX8_9ACTN|nr:SDR family NAD(P)-dependent oxidoreductase [Catenuloplanes nepalensis]MDP9793381.1 NAD(P)-dependent dehydrogenase (short-subunit alcohol dehydrogenase family) [Catenuloplanes nepalensis]